MRRFTSGFCIVIGVVLCFFLNTTFFTRVNINGIRPDAIIAFCVTIGVLLGGYRAAVSGVIVGLIIDIVFEKYIGLNAIAYLLAGVAGGYFYRKFYADNVIIPALTALVITLVKEHIFFIAYVLSGGKGGYFHMFIGYMIPCALLTAGICVLFRLILKPLLRQELDRQSEKRMNNE